MKIGFDFDGVLTNHQVDMFADELNYDDAHELFIISNRFADGDNSDIHSTFFLERNIYLLGGTGKNKEDIIKELDLDIFFEDDDICIQQIKQAGCKCLILKPIYDDVHV